jgi:hypothetical protein
MAGCSFLSGGYGARITITADTCGAGDIDACCAGAAVSDGEEGGHESS